MGWDLSDGLFYCFYNVILNIVQYCSLRLNELFMWEQFICVGSTF